jgi:SAM-dependent methyltransferase
VWRIESELGGSGAPYDRRAALYDRLVRSPTYNRLAWSTTPEDYARFAAEAIASADGPLLEVAAGSAAATAQLHAHSPRPTTLVDLSRAMLERAARRIAAAWDDDAHVIPAHIRLVQADLFSPPFAAHGFTTVLGLGLTHLFDDVPAFVSALHAQLAPGGEAHLAGLVAQTRRGRRYLELLHRAGEVAVPRTAEQLHVALGQPTVFRTTGCMAYAMLPAAQGGSTPTTRPD